MDAVMRTVPEPTSADWFTVHQFLERYGEGRTYTWAAHKLGDMHRSGVAERWTGSRAGRPGKITKYKLK